jgi:hypothetical protein
LAVARNDGDIDVFNAVTGKKVQSLKGHQSYMYALAFTPEARTLVVCFDDRTVEVRDVTTGKRLRQFSLPEDHQGPVGLPVGKPVFTAALSPDGTLLAFGSQDRYLVLKDMVTGQDIRRLDQLPDGVCPLAFSPDGKTLAWAGWRMGYAGWEDPAVHLVEVLTGRERHTLLGHGGRVLRLAFSGDGKRLISASTDTTALIWDLSGELSAEGRLSRPLAPREIEAAWGDLAGNEADRAYLSMQRLAASPAETIAYLREHLQAVPVVDGNHLSHLIADLDSNQFIVREKAAKKLENLGEVALGACRKALQGQPSAEVHRRLESLIAKQENETRNPSPERLRVMRAVEVLEMAGTPEAQKLLKSLANGAAEARLTQEARASLNRLAKQTSASH